LLQIDGLVAGLTEFFSKTRKFFLEVRPMNFSNAHRSGGAVVHSGLSLETGITMKRTRWTGRLVAGLLGITALGGCTKQTFLEPSDYQGALNNANLAKLESQPADPITTPLVSPSNTAAPATVLDPSRPPRYLTLKESIAIGLEQGNLGGPGTNPGNISDTLPSFTGRGSTGTDPIRTFALDPAISGAEMERALSKFDARWINSITWNKVDQPTLTLQQSFSNGDTASLSSTLAKPLPTGGVAGITFSTNYLNLSTPPSNPQFVTLTTSYTPRMQFIFEQPLLQGFGVEINQLLQSHPGSFQISGLRPSGGQGSEGILITRIRNEQQRAEYDRVINTMLLNIETAYWNLFSAYHNLVAQEDGLKQSLAAYIKLRDRQRIGLLRETLALNAKAQYHRFQAQALTARGQVLSSERNLRGLLGMRSDDGTRLVPVDEPTRVPYQPDYYEVVNEALQMRPELMIARQDLKARQLDLVLQRNLRRPDLRFFSSYDVAGLGGRLDGRNSAEFPNTNALQGLAMNEFNSWTLGLRLDMPLGFRDANALVRQAQLNMHKTYYYLLDSERKTVEVVAEQYRRVIQNNEEIRYRQEEKEALKKYAEIEPGFFDISTKEEVASFVFNLAQVLQNLATATSAEYQAVAQYNIALASLEFSKGTIQRYNNVTIADGPLPPYVNKKAIDHFKARDVALKLREHPSEAPTLAGWQPLTNYPPPPGEGPVAPGGQPSKPWELWQPGTGLPPGQPSRPMPPAGQPGAPMPPAGQPGTPMPPPRTLPLPGTTPDAGASGSFAPIGTLTLPKRNSGVPAIEPLPPTVAPQPPVVGIPTVEAPVLAPVPTPR